MEAELGRIAPWGNVVRPAEGRKEVIQRIVVRQVDNGELGANGQQHALVFINGRRIIDGDAVDIPQQLGGPNRPTTRTETLLMLPTSRFRNP